MKWFKLLPLLFLPSVLFFMASSSGSPGGKTGSTGDSGANCTQCHSGTANTSSGWVSTNIPVQGYIPGQTYVITATGTHSGVVKFGFELTAETFSGTKTGVFTITDATRTKLTNQNKAVTHRSAGTAPSGNTATWSVNWTAPSTDVGQVKFYAAFNAANGNGNNSGDMIYLSNTTVNAALPASLVSVTPDHTDQGTSVELNITGQNTFWTSATPVVVLRSVDNSSYTLAAQNISVNSNTSVKATFAVPNDALLGWYDVLVDDLSLSSAFYVSVLNDIAVNQENKLKLYPNPAQDYLMVSSDDYAILQIFDQTGRNIQTVNLSKGDNRIALESLTSGLYIARWTNGKIIKTDKFLVQ